MRKSYVKWSLFFGEVVLVYVSFAVAYIIRARLSALEGFDPDFTPADVRWMLPYLAGLAVPLYLFKFGAGRSNAAKQMARSLYIAATSAVFLFTVSFALKKFQTSRAFVIIYAATLLAVILAERLVVSRIRRYYARRGYDREYLMVVGEHEHIRTYVDLLGSERDMNFEISCVCAIDEPADVGECPLKFRHAIPGEIEQILRNETIDEVHIVSQSLQTQAEYEEVLKMCAQYGITVRIIPLALGQFGTQFTVEKIASLPALTISASFENEGQLLVKRLMDVFVSLVLLVVSLPVFLLCGIAVRLSGKGPVIYKHRRVGMNGRHFHLYKFRTMKEHVPASQLSFYGPFLKIDESDPRITKVGKALRKLSLDELPQLINVLKGDLSLVGPRPLVDEESRYLDKRQRKRFRMRPGITGLWQVKGRSAASAEDRIRLDVEYVENWSILKDIKILLMTIPAVLFAKGAK